MTIFEIVERLNEIVERSGKIVQRFRKFVQRFYQIVQRFKIVERFDQSFNDLLGTSFSVYWMQTPFAGSDTLDTLFAPVTWGPRLKWKERAFSDWSRVP